MLKCNFHLPDKIMRIKKPLKKFSYFRFTNFAFGFEMQCKMHKREVGVYWCEKVLKNPQNSAIYGSLADCPFLFQKSNWG